MKWTTKLLSIASEPLYDQSDPFLDGIEKFGAAGRELLDLLGQKNGFFAFESALQVFPNDSSGDHINLRMWNDRNCWRFEYGDMTDNMYFFAQDAFGDQFCIIDGDIYRFSSETGETELIGHSIEEWANRILIDCECMTGYPLMHEWQEINGPIPIGHRLAPKIPFVAGGEYKISNLYSLGSVALMKSKGNLARQIRDLPDGSRIEFKITD